MIELGGAPPNPEAPCPTCGGSAQVLGERPINAGRMSVPAWVACPDCAGRGVVRVDHPCACCGRTIDAQVDAGYSCAQVRPWHCAECHFADPHEAAAVVSSAGSDGPM